MGWREWWILLEFDGEVKYRALADELQQEPPLPPAHVRAVPARRRLYLKLQLRRGQSLRHDRPAGERLARRLRPRVGVLDHPPRAPDTPLAGSGHQHGIQDPP